MFARIRFPFADFALPPSRFVSPQQVWRADALADVAATLEAAEQAALSGQWVVGFVAYEAAPSFDPALRVREPRGDLPLAWFASFTSRHDDDSAEQAATADFFCKHWVSSLDASEASHRIGKIRHGIAEGDYYQVNLTMRSRSEFSGAPEALFDALAESQPAAYLAAIDWGAGAILSASPELFFRRSGNTVTARPMKGTAARSADPEADRAAAAALRESAKERAENLMIVDLLRNDLSRVARKGGVRTPSLFDLVALPTVWQMTSTVEADIPPDVGLRHLFAALFPCGSVTGAPKVAAMREIALLEDAPRGIYCGAIGVIKPGGDALFSVAIRTVEVAGGQATCGLGSGITIDSDAAAEYAEWLAKRRFLLRASAPFELLETFRLEGGRFARLDAHLARLKASAAWFGFPIDDAALAATLERLRGLGTEHPSRVRLLLRRNGEVRGEVFALEADPADARVVLAHQAIRGEREFLRHKTTERSAYAPFVPPAGVFDVLLRNEWGELTEFTRGNLFVEMPGGGPWLTPPLACGLLPGVLRGELIAQGRAREAILREEDLRHAIRLWFGNSLRGLIAVRLLREGETLAE
jgi:para-aminobenzoate synthetase/4-amino-4-deoxychorismate lyase